MAKIKLDPIALITVLGKLTEILLKAQAAIQGEPVTQDFTVKSKGYKYEVNVTVTKTQ